MPKQTRYAVVDVETSGFSIEDDEVLEIAIVRVEAGMISEPWVSLVRPTKPVPLRAIKVHGLDNDILVTAPRKEVVAQAARARLKGAVLVEHSQNGFDRRFLAEFLGDEPWKASVSTVREGKKMFPELGKYDLPTLCAHLRIPLPTHHSAGADALATAQILTAMIERGAFSGYLEEGE
jgi:DNA polymerase III epsilon subunit-like protein